ncbi:extensin family protein [Methylobacterium brachythecii]|nr:extensin family protein [Methylobacterium brachythecii]
MPLPPARPPELSQALQLKVAPPSPPDLPTCAPSVAEPPLPPGRPAELSPNSAPGKASPPPDLAPPSGLPEEAPLPPARPAELSGDEAAKLAPAVPEDTECLRRLDGLGVTYAKLAPTVNGQCSLPHPLSVSALGGGISIGAPALMTCRLAEGLMRWTAEVQQIADREFGEPLKGFTLGGTYVCRGQNHGVEAQLSEHSFANAVDVMGFTFAKRTPILVGTTPEGSKEAAFVADVRKKACEAFSTVLGPGSDEHHANHLHLDQRERKAGYRLCQ